MAKSSGKRRGALTRWLKYFSNFSRATRTQSLQLAGRMAIMRLVWTAPSTALPFFRFCNSPPEGSTIMRQAMMLWLFCMYQCHYFKTTLWQLKQTNLENFSISNVYCQLWMPIYASWIALNMQIWASLLLWIIEIFIGGKQIGFYRFQRSSVTQIIPQIPTT